VLWLDVNAAYGPDALDAALQQWDLNVDRAVLEALQSGRTHVAEVVTPFPRFFQGSSLHPDMDIDPWEPPLLLAGLFRVVVGPDWMLSARMQPFHVAGGASGTIDFADVVAEVGRHFNVHRPTGSDLAAALFTAIADTYGIALDAIDTRLQASEQFYMSYYDRAPAGRKQAEAAHRAQLGRLKFIIESAVLTIRQMMRYDSDFWDNARDLGTLAAETHTRLQTQDRRARGVRDELRAAYDLLAAVQTVDVLAAAAQSGERQARLQRTLAYFGAVLLLPTLWATIFGALPAIAAKHAEARFALIFGGASALAVIGAVAVYLRGDDATAPESGELGSGSVPGQSGAGSRCLGRKLCHGDLYAAYRPTARRVATGLQMAIGVASVLIIGAHFAVKLVNGDLPSLSNTTNELLSAIGIALAAAAVVQLAYTLFTEGPDEALDPLMLGLAAALLLLVGGLDAGVTLGRAAALLLLGILLSGLFATRLFLAESTETPKIWWLPGDHREPARTAEQHAPDAVAPARREGSD
jgi:hypothetical protein